MTSNGITNHLIQPFTRIGLGDDAFAHCVRNETAILFLFDNEH